jgi:hypothetical protein
VKVGEYGNGGWCFWLIQQHHDFTLSSSENMSRWLAFFVTIKLKFIWSLDKFVLPHNSLSCKFVADIWVKVNNPYTLPTCFMPTWYF